MGKQLLEKLKESLLSVIPITIIVVLINFFIPLGFWNMISFVIGAVMLIFGMGLFTLGADMSMMNVGVGVGKYITKQKKLWVFMLIPFIIGILITIAEPDLIVLANQVVVPGMDSAKLIIIIAVALGVGIFLVIALLRVALKIDIRWILLGCYILVFIIAFYVPSNLVPFSFDSGGVTTGPMTVPFIMAVGLGVASMSGKDSKDDSFGYVALCSIGPILVVLLLGLVLDIQVATSSSNEVINTVTDFSKNLSHTVVEMIKEVAIAILPILAFICIFVFVLFKESKKNIIKIFIGLLYVYIGLTLFLTGANMGFMPIGAKIGDIFGVSTFKWILIPLGMIMGFFVVMAEPAVHVLNHQVEEVTGGAIPKKMMLFGLAIGVAISLGLAMARVVFNFSIWYVLIPGYAIALILMAIVPKVFTSIAFDSGGVASGPMTATFLLPMATGACMAIYGENKDLILSNGFGIVALVAMTPLIVIQILGLIYKIKLHINFLRKEYPYEDVIEFDIDFKSMK